MKYPFLLAACGVLLMNASPLLAAERTPAAPSTSLPTLGVPLPNPTDRKVDVTYKDADGNTIPADDFMKAMKAGRHFNIRKEGGKATFMLLSVDASSGNDASTALMGNKLTIKPGDTLPVFDLPGVAGGTLTSTNLAGKPTIVDFFFAECVACIQELPALNAFAAKHPQMNVVAITFDDADTAAKFVHKRGFQWPVAYNGSSYLRKIGVNAYPTLLLLNADNELVAVRTGGIPFDSSRDDSPVSLMAPETNDPRVKQSQLQWLDYWVENVLPGH